MFLTGNACGADFYNSSLDKSDSPGEPGGDSVSDAPSTPSSELRRRSERVRREKPDYYDALDFDTKRRSDKYSVLSASGSPSTPTRGKRSDKIPYKSPRGMQESTPKRGRPRIWKKGQDDDDYVDPRSSISISDKRKKKKKHLMRDSDSERGAGPSKDCSSRDSFNDPEEDLSMAIDDLPPEKSLQCQVSLAEINRKLGVVMCQPV